MPRLCLPILLLLLLAGCAHAPLNRELPSASQDSGYLLDGITPMPGPEKLAVSLYFSGGGIRAAALSYGVMKELAATPLPSGARLLDRVCVINTVSGGSFTGAYYCLFGEKLFENFERDFLKQNIQHTLSNRCLSPVGVARLASDTFARSDLAAELYDERLFHGATFADLKRQQGRLPFLVINATNISNGVPFVFTQDQFNMLNSDLASFPVSRAVAASSAFPVLLTPITLRNYRPPALTSSPVLTKQPLGNASIIFDSVRSSLRDSMRMYQHSDKHPYVHLADGGLADNLGLKSMLNYVSYNGGWTPMLAKMRRQGIQRHAIIIVNAATEGTQPWDQMEQTPTSKTLIKALSSCMINQRNTETITMARTSIALWRSEQQVLRADEQDLSEIYFIVVDFHLVQDPVERDFFNHIPTRLHLPAETVDRIVTKAGELLRASPDFQLLLKDLHP